MTMHATVGRPQSLGEEIANSVSHGVGLLAALVGAPILLLDAVRHGSRANVAGAAAFVASVVLLYLASTLYHAFPHGRAKSAFRTLDHAAIFLLIAGTYTPFTLGVLHGPWGWLLFGLVWSLAVVGVLLKVTSTLRHPVLSTALYLTMGWLALIAVRPLWVHVPPAGLLWLFAGGLAYTVGVAFFAARRLRYAHFIWHLWVLTGTGCHFFAVLRYAA
jgi:hemolysin III